MPTFCGRQKLPTTSTNSTDTFVVSSGKIMVQSFAAKVTPKH